MKNKIILHLPHANTELPKEFYNNDLLKSSKELNQFNLDMSDLYTDELFNAEKYTHVQAKYSRIFCDVEKFVKDFKEPMAKLGMGMIYSRDLKGEMFVKTDRKYKKEVLKNYYKPYHQELTDVVKNELRENNVILLDCHSFSRKTIQSFAEVDYIPDICIGVNDATKHNYKLITSVLYYFNELGYDVMINYPYSGSIVPNKIKKRTKNFYSIMIEINKDLYLNANNEKSENFNKVKNDIFFLEQLIEKMDLKWEKTNEIL